MKPHETTHARSGTHYGRLALMIVLSFISMYVLMYGMVNRFANRPFAVVDLAMRRLC
jgi:heme/copper-type cytochrome/quinol oxidase subunit 4